MVLPLQTDYYWEQNIMSIETEYVTITPIEACPEYDRHNIHQHDYYELIWFTEAADGDTVQIDFGNYPVSGDSFFFVSAGQLHRIDRTGKRGLVIALSKDFFHSIVPVDVYPRSTFAINTIINQKKCDMCRTMVKLIITEYEGAHRYQLFEAYFKALFIHLGPVFSQSPCCGSKRKAADLLDLVEELYVSHRDVQFYAQQLALSDKAANNISKKVLGRTIKEVLQDRLVLEVKREIATGKLSFKEIAAKLGFNEPSYFTRFFKTQTGFTPEEYKEQFQAQLDE